jgi:hypothetical protein
MMQSLWPTADAASSVNARISPVCISPSAAHGLLRLAQLIECVLCLLSLCVSDFAALAQTKCGPLQSYIAFTVFYALMLAFTLWQATRYAHAMGWKWRVLGNAFHQHTLIAFICFFRLLGSAYYSSDATGWQAGGVAFILSVPYALSFVVFTMLIAQWFAIEHFAMSGGNPFLRVRTQFVVLNVIYSLLVFILFVATAASGNVTTKQQIAVAASSILAIGHTCDPETALQHKAQRHHCTHHIQPNHQRIGGLVLVHAFGESVGQAQRIHHKADGDQNRDDQNGFRAHSQRFTAPFLVFDLITLCCALSLFWSAVQSAVDKANPQKEKEVDASSTKPTATSTNTNNKSSNNKTNTNTNTNKSTAKPAAEPSSGAARPSGTAPSEARLAEPSAQLTEVQIEMKEVSSSPAPAPAEAPASPSNAASAAPEPSAAPSPDPVAAAPAPAPAAAPASAPAPAPSAAPAPGEAVEVQVSTPSPAPSPTATAPAPAPAASPAAGGAPPPRPPRPPRPTQ